MAVVVTGLGAVSCFGGGVPALWDGLLRADAEPVPAPEDCGLASRPNLYPATGFADPTSGGRTTAMALAAVAEAIGHSGLTPGDLLDAGLTVGTSLGDIDLAEAAGSGAVAVHTVAAGVASGFGIGGPNHTLSTACSAGAYAVSWGAELIETGQADVVIACGSDAFSRVAVGTLHRFELLDSTHCRPFDAERGGMVTGEGAAAVVLESAESARRRGAEVIVELAGHGWSCDAHHPMAPEPSGGQLSRAAGEALAGTGAPPGAVVLHRNGVQLNDTVESIAVAAAFDELAAGGAAGVAGYAPKAVLGHTAGAAGVFGCVIAALILRHGLVPPNAHVRTLDPDCPLIVPLGGPVPLDRPAVLVSGTGFGGNNAALAWRRAS
ncbi:beta-ketoacyl-[acyl-carrier-protein] synthase family protein [Amycolatopsis sp. H20-H5]|uniref:beta-ketoacyl-[acyl-carrier-protein] synthase family protein n=1 Tax=Amycolatopsis sp. H20-H5 TaxID=3046309 RepID=UPI002DB8DC63|nr:beta-ketoacyl synthase N-terminal-like domain-containing protein [Amycolatopsis sp. H20-H5]MEC3976384.1 beta-ketoacyl synthase N-terminal-like domain-containing protein [Amycolatopsis sp. H20-H5]